MSAAFRVVLRDAEGHDGLGSREFDLPLNTTFPIGRSSRNNTKRELMPAKHNAYIDSPVISRDHALLSTSADAVAPSVFLTDTDSMHGTLVNGQRLTPRAARQLSSGDSIQFGIDVNRNEEYYVARKYTFEAQFVPQQPTFSLGFTVPESEEEDIAGTIPRRGSQSNPLTIDESDSEPETSDNEQPDTTMPLQSFSFQEGSTSIDDIHLPQEASSQFSEDDESLGDYPSDMQEDDGEGDMDSQVSNLNESEVDFDSDFGVSDVEIAIEIEDEIEDAAATVGQQTASADTPALILGGPPSLPAWATRDMTSSYDRVQWEGAELPPMSMFKETIDTNVISSFPPPLPPRTSATRPAIFSRGDVAFSQKPAWLSDDADTFSNFLGTNHGDRPSLFSPAPVSTVSPTAAVEATASAYGSISANFAPINNNRMQTPPAMPTSDVISSTPPPTRRTEISITEIVEEQPPTPTSVNEMKRKAYVLDEEETPEAEQVVVPAEHIATVIVPVSEVTAPQTAAIIAQRPKKTPRSLISKLGSTATYFGYGAAGAAGAFALLSALPDAFFV